MKKALLFLAVVLMGLGVMAQTTYTRITSETELSSGDKVIFVGFHDDGTIWAMSYQKTNNRKAVQVTLVGDDITTVVATEPGSTVPFEFTIGGQSGAWTFFDEVTNGYLYASGGGNYLNTQGTLDDKGQWNLVEEEDGFQPISNGAGIEQNNMRYNMNTQNNDPLFGCYKSTSTVPGLVYIYRSGEPIIYPEPTNYPVNFDYSFHMTDLTLSWTILPDGQLPRACVVIGSTHGEIPVPVDGEPVDDEYDPYDGYLAFNTSDNSVFFDFLEPASEWTFAIFPYTNSGINIDYKTDGQYPVVEFMVPDIECLFSSDFGNGLEPFITYNVEGEQVWGTSSYQGMPYANMNGYSGGSAYANEDWLITPNVIAAGSIANDYVTVFFKNAYKFDGNPLQIFMSAEYNEGDDPNNYPWQDVTSYFTWSSGNFQWVDTRHAFYVTGMTSLYFAFRYTCTDDAASNWEVAEFKIYSGDYDVEENSVATFALYPNPATSSISIVAENAAEVQIMDMAGRMVKSVNAVEGVNSIDVADLRSGVYFVRMNGAVVKFVKK